MLFVNFLLIAYSHINLYALIIYIYYNYNTVLKNLIEIKLDL